MKGRLPLVGGLVAVVLVAAWFLLLWQPAGTHLRSLRANDATATATHAQLESRLAGLEALRRSLPAAEAQLKRSLPGLPSTVSADTAIDQINAIAIADHIAWSNETQAVTAADAAGTAPSSGTGATGAAAALGASTLSLTLTVSGRYGDMRRFISQLQERPRLIVIDSLAYSPSAHGVGVALVARAFYDPTALPVTTVVSSS